jgi:Na+:H+ antiporter, NhaA family
LNQAKFGIICGTVLSGIIGYIYLSKVLPKENLIDVEDN